jgi:DNA-binding CsgD family transcriptional regulator
MSLPGPRVADATPLDADVALAMLDGLPYGVIVLNTDGRPRVLNGTARAILAERDGLEDSPHGLRAGVSQDTVALRNALSSLQQPGGSVASHWLSFTRPSGRPPILATLSSLPGRAVSVDGLAWLVVVDLERKRAIDGSALSRWYGLTKSEVGLTLLLAEGRSVDEAADRLCISMNTARTHLKRIFLKTGTSRQAQLVRLVLALPAPAATV